MKTRCDVELVQDTDGNTKRALVNGEPVAGLLAVGLSSGPRKPTTVTLTLHPTSVITSDEVA